MTAIHGVWVSSFLGALLFSLAGYLVARLRGAPASARGRAPVPPDPAASGLKAQLPRAGEENAALVAKRDAAVRELQRAGEENAALVAKHDAAVRELQRAGEENAALVAKQSAAVAALRQAREESAALAAKHDAAVRELQRAGEENAASVAKQSGRAANLEQRSLAAGEQEKARTAEVASLRAELDSAWREREAALREARAVAVKLEQAARARDAGEKRTVALEALQKKLEQAEADGKARATEVARLRASLEQLQGEKKELIARLGKPAPASAAKSDPTLARAEVERLRQEFVAATLEREAALARVKALEAEAERLRQGAQAFAAAERIKLELELEQAQRERTRLEAESVVTRGELEVRRREASAREDRIARLQADLAVAGRQGGERVELEREVLEQRARLASLDGKLAQMERLEQERFELKAQLKERDSRLEELGGLRELEDERHDLALQVEALKQREEEARSLREERSRLAGELKERSRERVDLEGRLHDLEGVERVRMDLTIRVGLLEAQLDTLEKLREENVVLRDEAKQAASLRAELARLTSELAGLRSQGLHRELPPSAPVASLPVGSLAGTLQSLLEQVAKDGRTRGAAVADEAGLVVASTGGESEALAGAAALLVDSATRVLRNILPLGGLRNLSVVDENEVTIAALPLTVKDHSLILATLSVGPGPDPSVVRGLVLR